MEIILLMILGLRWDVCGVVGDKGVVFTYQHTYLPTYLLT